jgi:hypothetical protein
MAAGLRDGLVLADEREGRRAVKAIIEIRGVAISRGAGGSSVYGGWSG